MTLNSIKKSPCKRKEKGSGEKARQRVQDNFIGGRSWVVGDVATQHFSTIQIQTTLPFFYIIPPRRNLVPIYQQVCHMIFQFLPAK